MQEVHMSEGTGSIDLNDYINRFRKKLVDLTRNNRLLNFRESKRTSIRIVDELPDEINDHLIERTSTFYFDALDEGMWALPEQGATDLADRPNHGSETDRRHIDNRLQTRMSQAELQKSLNSIRTKANTAIEETGINYLFMALGFLEWYESPDSKRPGLAPLVLIPVKINRTFDQSVGEYVQSLEWNGEDIQSNYALIEFLNNDFGIVVPELEPEEKPEAYFRRVGLAVTNRVAQDDRWQIKRRANLGFFSFAKLLMYQDLDPTKWPEGSQLDQNSHLRRLFTGEKPSEIDNADGLRFNEDYNIDKHPTSPSIAVVDNADSSQHSALIDIHEGRNLVIEGPPGTGKSQTITNAIAAAMAEGKSVLFVSEKLAALEVVRDKLNHLGLGDFCLELHSEKATPRKVLDDLATRMGSNYARAEQLSTKKKLLEGEKQKIAEYLDAVAIRVGPYEDPLYDIFWRIVALKQSGVPKILSADVNTDWDITEFDKRCRHLESLAHYAVELGNPTENPWFGFFCPTLRGEAACHRVDSLLRDIIHQGESIGGLIIELVGENNPANTGAFHKLASTVNLAAIDVKLLNEVKLPQDTLTNDILLRLATGRLARVHAYHFCDCVANFQEMERKLTSIIPGDPEDAGADAAELSTRIRKLFDDRLDDIKLREVKSLREVCNNAIRLLDEIEGYVNILANLGHPRPNYLRGLEEVVSQHDLMMRSDTFDWGLLDSKHYLAGAMNALAKARKTAAMIQQRRDNTSRRLNFEMALQRNDLKVLSNSLRLYQGQRFHIVKSDYRRLYRDIKSMLHPPRPKIGVIADLLDEVCEYRELCTKLREHRETAMALGPIFTGIDTNWDNAEYVIGWAAKARELGIGYEKARHLRSLYSDAHELPSSDTIRDTVKLLNDELRVSLLNSLILDKHTDDISVSIPQIRTTLREIASEADAITSCTGKFNTDENTTLRHVVSMAEEVKQYISIKKSINSGNTDLTSYAGPDNILPGEYSRKHITKKVFIQSIIGEAFLGTDTDITRVRHAVRWAEHVADTKLPQEIIAWLCSGDIAGKQQRLSVSLAQILSCVQGYENALKALDGLTSPASDIRCFPVDDPVRVIERCKIMLEHLAELPRWTDWCRAVDQAYHLNLKAFLDAAETKTVSYTQLRDTFELTFFNSLAESQVQSHPELRGFSRIDMESARRRFRELDEEIIALERRHVATRAAQRDIPHGVGSGRVRDLTELALIEHEIPKQRKLCRVRQLMTRSKEAIKALKPCFMMSPLSVAQFLPKGEVEFDLVLFDEASQVKPEDAIGAIVRGRQVVVVGDPKQLPPTSFFDKLSDDEIDEDDLMLADETESILEVAMKSTGHLRRLKWHYRSEHESLIAFSNERFYDGELVVFPSPVSGSVSRSGVSLRTVQHATYVPKQGNLTEAQAVAKAITDHAVTCPHDSLGVGCFNRVQRDLIEECLDHLCSDDAAIRYAVQKMREESDESLFIKNLENLQGDERDVILISYGWAPERCGEKPHQRFGPIGYEDGWRRLNVLITRARRRIEIFSSITPSQIVGGPGKSKGVNAMKDYLEYAQTGMIPDRGVVTDREPDSPFETAVGRVLTSLGLEYDYQVGVAGYFIDIAVKHPERTGEYVLGIECDGATYHSAKSARDRDRLRESVIRNRGWNLHRIWSTDWFYDQASEIERLKEYYACALVNRTSS